MDTAVFLAGALCGALVGETGIPEQLASGLLEAPHLMASADDLYGAWLGRARARGVEDRSDGKDGGEEVEARAPEDA